MMKERGFLTTEFELFSLSLIKIPDSRLLHGFERKKKRKKGSNI